MRTPKKIPVASFIVLSSLVLSSCSFFHDTSPVRFHQQEEAGSVHVAVQSVAPFEGYINSLQPQFALNSEQALAEAIQQTQTEDSQVFRALLASLNISGPQISGSKTTTLNADGTTTTSGTSTTKPGDASTVVAAAAAPANPLGTLTLPSTTVGLDRSLKYQAAASLLQYVTGIDNYVRDAAIRRAARPYLVRLLVTLLPSARLEPYDAYSTISLFESATAKESLLETTAAKSILSLKPTLDCQDKDQRATKDCHKGSQPKITNSDTKPEPEPISDCQGRPIDVLPLLVTDNLESSLHSAAVDRIRDFALAIQAFSGNTSVAGNTRARSEDANKTLNNNLNSLLTLAQLAPNTIEARMGATFANGNFEMIPRTYTVTVIALVPTGGTGIKNEIIPCSDLTFTAQTRMRDAERGTLLPAWPVDPINRQLKQLADNWGLQYDRSTRSDFYDLVMQAEAGSFDGFKRRLEVIAHRQKPSWITAERARMIWGEVVALSTLTGRSSGDFQVPLREVKFFNDGTHGTLVDDGKTTTLRLTGGLNIAGDRLYGTLRVTANDQDFYINNTEASVDLDGRSATLKFDSLYKLLKKKPPTKVNATVEYDQGAREWQWVSAYTRVWWPQHPVKPGEIDYKLTRAGDRFREDPIPYILSVDDQKELTKPGFTMTVPSRSIHPDHAGIGQLAVEFRSTDKKKPQSVHFGVTGGAFIDRVVPDVPLSGAERIVQTDSAFVLTLKNLIPGSAVKLHAFRLDGDNEVPVDDVEVAVVGR
jgi:hypothetical protein